MSKRKRQTSSQRQQNTPSDPQQSIERVPVPNEKARAQAQAILTRIESQMHVRSETYQSSLPHPDTLAAIDALVPGSAKKIIDLMVKQSNHRMSLEKTVIEGDSRRATLGVYAGGGVTIGAFVLAGVFAYFGLSIEALGVFVAALATLASVFVYGNKNRQQERERARQNMEDAKKSIRGR